MTAIHWDRILGANRAVTTPGTILRDIRAAIDVQAQNARVYRGAGKYWLERADYHRVRDLQDQAANAFGKLNGWRTSPDYTFTPSQLGRWHNSYNGYARSWGDHAIYYRAPRQDGKRGWMNVAIVGQPYGWARMPVRSCTTSSTGRDMLSTFHPPRAQVSGTRPRRCSSSSRRWASPLNGSPNRRRTSPNCAPQRTLGSTDSRCWMDAVPCIKGAIGHQVHSGHQHVLSACQPLPLCLRFQTYRCLAANDVRGQEATSRRLSEL
jgi:hypothetical protein